MPEVLGHRTHFVVGDDEEEGCEPRHRLSGGTALKLRALRALGWGVVAVCPPMLRAIQARTALGISRRTASEECTSEGATVCSSSELQTVARSTRRSFF